MARIECGTMDGQERWYYMITICAISLTSLLCSVSILVIIGFRNLFKKIQHRLVLYLFIGDLMQAVGASISFLWLFQCPQADMWQCTLQGWLFIFSENVATLWSATIALFLVLCIWVSSDKYRPGKKFEQVSQFIWLLSLFISTMALLSYPNPDDPFIAPHPNGFWCYIADNRKLESIILQFGMIFFLIVFVFVSYLFVAYYLWKRGKKSYEVNFTSAFKKLLGFPIVFFIVFSPGTILHFVSLVTPIPSGFLFAAGAFIFADGALNAITYGYTRKLCCINVKEDKENRILYPSNYYVQ